MPAIHRILTTTALCLAAWLCVGCCNAAAKQVETQQNRVKPTHEEARLRHIRQAEDKLARCRELLETMQAEVEVYGPGQDSPRYAVKAEDMPRLRYIISKLQVNPEFAPVRLTHLYCLNLDFGEGEKLSLRAERITTPGCVGIAHTGSLYALPTPELRRELIGIILRAVSEK